MTSFTRTDTARLPSGITTGRPDPASLPASFIGRIGSFWMTGITRPRPMISSGAEKAPVGHRALRPLDDAEIVRPDLGAELEIGGGDHDRLGRQRDGLHRHVLHVAIGAESQAAAGGDGQKQHESDAHASHGNLLLSLVPHESLRVHHHRATKRGGGSDEARHGLKHDETERVVDADLRGRDRRRR